MSFAHKYMRYPFMAALVAGILLAWGCEEDYLDHDPPDGMGSVVIDNKTGNDIKVFFDGYETNRVDSYDHEIYDRDPGVYRLVLDERHGDRSYRDDIDVLSGRLTVLEVFENQSLYGYAVYVSYH